MAEAIATVNVPPAALSIIKEGTPKPQTPLVLTTAAVRPQGTDSLPTTESLSPPEPAKITRPKTEKRISTETVTFVSVNYRLPSHIPGALSKASAERKFEKVYPATQQEIVAVAVTDWLKKNGYLS